VDSQHCLPSLIWRHTLGRMLEVLESPEVRRHVAPITITRYHRMIELGVFDEWPVELLSGVLVEKMSKSELHVYLVKFLYQALAKFCAESQWHVGKEDPITIGDSEPEPDISVIQGQLSDFRHAKPTTAQLVIEVAISSLALDRAKARDYAKACVPEYWVVQPEAKTIEVYRHPIAGAYSEKMEVSAESTLESTALPGFSFNLSAALAE